MFSFCNEYSPYHTRWLTTEANFRLQVRFLRKKISSLSLLIIFDHSSHSTWCKSKTDKRAFWMTRSDFNFTESLSSLHGCCPWSCCRIDSFLEANSVYRRGVLSTRRTRFIPYFLPLEQNECQSTSLNGLLSTKRPMWASRIKYTTLWLARMLASKSEFSRAYNGV